MGCTTAFWVFSVFSSFFLEKARLVPEICSQRTCILWFTLKHLKSSIWDYKSFWKTASWTTFHLRGCWLRQETRHIACSKKSFSNPKPAMCGHALLYLRLSKNRSQYLCCGWISWKRRHLLNFMGCSVPITSVVCYKRKITLKLIWCSCLTLWCSCLTLHISTKCKMQGWAGNDRDWLVTCILWTGWKYLLWQKVDCNYEQRIVSLRKSDKSVRGLYHCSMLTTTLG